MSTIRDWLGRRVLRFALWLLPPEAEGPPCVDCHVPLPLGCDPDECPTCIQSADEQDMFASAYDEGCRDGYREAEHAFGEMP